MEMETETEVVLRSPHARRVPVTAKEVPRLIRCRMPTASAVLKEVPGAATRADLVAVLLTPVSMVPEN